MGNSQPHIDRSRRTSSSFYDRKSESPDVIKKFNEKECVFIAMQSEIDKAITENNRDAMKSLTSEIAAHILDLNQLKKIELTSTNRGRAQKIIYNFELSLAKLKSIYNYDTAMKKERDRHFSPSNSSSPYVERDSVRPDIVNDLIRFDNANNVHRSSFREPRSPLPDVPETETNPQISRTNSIYSNQPQTFEDDFVIIESEFGVLKNQAQRPVEDVDEYYQMDKGVFYLYVKVKNLELPEDSTLNERKLRLIKGLAEFRTILDRKSGELEEHREMNQEINTLELLLDSTSENEIANLRDKALMLQERIETSSWEPYLTERKIELLKRLARFLERIAFTSPSSSIENSVQHIYGNLNSLQEEQENQEILKTQQEPAESKNEEPAYSIIEHADTSVASNDNAADNELELEHGVNEGEENSGNELELEHGDNEDETNESIYGNVEIIKQNMVPKISRHIRKTGSNVSPRGTVYVNEDIVRLAGAYENHVLLVEDDKAREVIAKRPLPLPRNYDDKVINDLPRNWQRLNEIFDKESLNDTDKSEIADIQRHAEVAKNLFERKIKRIIEKFEDTVEL